MSLFDKVGTALGLFPSAIKSGEHWTPTCQKVLDEANAELQGIEERLRRLEVLEEFEAAREGPISDYDLSRNETFRLFIASGWVPPWEAAELKKAHDARVTELLAANNAEVERRRKAERIASADIIGVFDAAMAAVEAWEGDKNPKATMTALREALGNAPHPTFSRHPEGVVAMKMLTEALEATRCGGCGEMRLIGCRHDACPKGNPS